MVAPPWERLREKYHAAPVRGRAANLLPTLDMVNREFIRERSRVSSVPVLRPRRSISSTATGSADNWFLQIETFDPHEPFYAPAEFRERFRTGWNGPIRDWPRYGRVDEVAEECEELRANYYARRRRFCDALLGRLLDYVRRKRLCGITPR